MATSDSEESGNEEEVMADAGVSGESSGDPAAERRAQLDALMVGAIDSPHAACPCCDAMLRAENQSSSQLGAGEGEDFVGQVSKRKKRRKIVESDEED